MFLYGAVSLGGTLWLAAIVGVATHWTFRFFEPRSPIGALKISTTVPTLVLLLTQHPYSWSLTFLVAFYSGFYGSLCLSLVLYRLSPFHPLADFPGPVLYKVSKIPGMVHSWTGRQHLVFKAIHDAYGPFVRIGPNEVSIVDESAVPAVFGASGLQKGQYYLARKDPNAPGNLIVLTGEDHANRRRLWNRGMGSEALREYDLIIHKRGEQLVEKLTERSGQALDMSAWFGYYTFDFMGDMAFGGGYEMLRDSSDKHDRWGVLERFITMAGIISHVPWASQTIQKIPLLKQDLVKMRSYAVQVASQRYASGSRTKDLWYHLSDEAGLEKTKPTLRNIISDGALAIVAGTDTTATGMTTLLYFLCRYPDVYRKAQEEVDAVFPEGAETMDASKHSELVYLTACLHETLRILPPVPTGGPRQVPYDEGKIIAGRYIPPGTQVYVPTYCLHHDPRYFHDPEAFIPERWITTSSSLSPDTGFSSSLPLPQQIPRNQPPASSLIHEPQSNPQSNASTGNSETRSIIKDPLAYIPFSYGPANCVGKNLAKREILLVVSTLLQKFEFKFADQNFDPVRWAGSLPDHFITTKIPLMIKVSVRSRS